MKKRQTRRTLKADHKTLSHLIRLISRSGSLNESKTEDRWERFWSILPTRPRADFIELTWELLVATAGLEDFADFFTEKVEELAAHRRTVLERLVPFAVSGLFSADEQTREAAVKVLIILNRNFDARLSQLIHTELIDLALGHSILLREAMAAAFEVVFSVARGTTAHAKKAICLLEALNEAEDTALSFVVAFARSPGKQESRSLTSFLRARMDDGNLAAFKAAAMSLSHLSLDEVLDKRESSSLGSAERDAFVAYAKAHASD